MPKVRKLLEDFFDAEHIVESAINPDEAAACGHIVESVNPDEAAACGAAVQAAILSGEASLEERCRLLHDVTGLSLGVGTRSSGSVTLLFPWNTTLPAAVRKLNVFTDFENQPEILLLVYEGEGLLTEDNVLLGEIQLSGFSPGPPGTQITVSFDIDMNGILNVSAEDMKQNKISAVVRNKARLSKQEINKMVQEAAAEYQNKLGCNNVLEGYVLI
jgi:molecular chaperone DnaK (HSP70)